MSATPPSPFSDDVSPSSSRSHSVTLPSVSDSLTLPLNLQPAESASPLPLPVRAAPAPLPSFLPLPVPSPDAPPPPAMSDIERVQTNARMWRSESENHWISVKMRVVLGVFVASVALLPLLACALAPQTNASSRPAALSRPSR